MTRKDFQRKDNKRYIPFEQTSDYLGLMPYVITPTYSHLMKELTSALSILDAIKMGEIIPHPLSIGFEYMNEYVVSCFQDKKSHFNGYLMGLGIIKHSIYELKNNNKYYVDYYFHLLNNLVKMDNRFAEYDCITFAPSSDPNKISGLESIVNIFNDRTDKDGKPLLIREYKKTPKHISNQKKDDELQNDMQIVCNKKYNGIIIIDDVLTTGKTLAQCTKLLNPYSKLPIIHICLTITVNLSDGDRRLNRILNNIFRKVQTYNSITHGNPKQRKVKHWLKMYFLSKTSYPVLKALTINQIAFSKEIDKLIGKINSSLYDRIDGYFKVEIFNQIMKS